MDSQRSDSRIFVVGFGRSGTTLLRAVLSRHTRIAVPPETHFLKLAEAAGGPEGPPEDFEAFWSWLIGHVRFRDLGIDPAAVRERLECGGDHSFRSMFDAILDTYGARLDKPRVGEKTPGHSHYLDTLTRWYPEARFLVLQRDPRGAIASFLKTPWVRKEIFAPSLRHGLATGNPSRAIARLSGEWEDHYTRLFAPWKDDPRFRTVSYERLVLDPEDEVRSICEFLAEDFEPGMLGDGEPVPDASGKIGDRQWDDWRRRHQERSKQPVSRDSLTKWRSVLTRSQTALIEARCRDGMAACGYVPETQRARRSLSSAAGRVQSGAARLEERARGLMARQARN